MAVPSLSLSALIATWFTPSSLFIFLNLIIGTIAISSRFGAPKRQINDSHDSPQLLRSPSLLQRVRSFRLTHDTPTVAITESTHHPQLVRTPSLLERVKSFNFGIYTDEQPRAEMEYAQPNHPEPENENPHQPQLTRAPSLLQRLHSMNFSRLYKSDSIHAEEKPEPEAVVSDSDPGRDSGSEEGGNVVEMRKSASERRGAVRSEWEEEEGAVERRRPMTVRGETTSSRADEEVDAKADDFINRFKKQLRLQRVNSIIRYREMHRGN